MNETFFTEGRFCFDFRKSNAAYKVDIPSLNGLGGVDFIIECENRFMFVEIKDLEDKRVPSENRRKWIEKLKISNDNPFLIDLGVKFKDTIIRKWAKEEELNKPIWYIIILQLNAIDAAFKLKLAEDLSGRLPTCIGRNYGFKKEVIIKRREILSVEDWLKRYPEFPIEETESR